MPSPEQHPTEQENNLLEQKLSQDVPEITASQPLNNKGGHELVLDFSNWDTIQTDQIPNFYKNLSEQLPALAGHDQCYGGQGGGFLSEVKQGTNLAHVIEHITLELIHQTEPDQKYRQGLTSLDKENPKKHIIHFGAPNNTIADKAARMALDIVKKISQDHEVNFQEYIDLLGES